MHIRHLHFMFKTEKGIAELSRWFTDVFNKNAVGTSTFIKWFQRFENKDYELQKKQHIWVGEPKALPRPNIDLGYPYHW